MPWAIRTTTKAVITTSGDADIEIQPSVVYGCIQLKFGGCLVQVDANDLIHAALKVACDAGIEVPT